MIKFRIIHEKPQSSGSDPGQANGTPMQTHFQTAIVTLSPFDYLIYHLVILSTNGKSNSIKPCIKPLLYHS